MTESNKKQLRELYKQYDLNKDDIFTNPTQGWTIITRSGIDKVQAIANIDIKYQLVLADAEFKTYVVKATATHGDTTIETFGESSPENTKQKYRVAMSEKRAMSRAVLKLTGFYQIGVYGEEEADQFNVPKSERKSVKELIEDTL